MTQIIYPMFALVLLTFAVGLSLGISRLISEKKGQVDRRYFKLFSGYEAPDNIVKLSRNFSNLLEAPVLFYILGTLVIALGINSSIILGSAWCFVALRLAHSLIHITYNNTIHRFLAFLVSSLLTLIMWIELIIIVSQRT